MTMVLRAKPLSDVVRGIIKRDNGCWLDASDLSTMYQDAAGATPVTAMEQPVGLWLDKSQGLQLGPELVTNGAFDTGIDGWSNEFPERGNISWNSTSQRLRVDNTTGYGDAYVYTSIPVSAGKIYKFIVDVVDISGGMTPNLLKVYWRNVTTYTTNINVTSSTANRYEFIFGAQAGSVGFILGTTYPAGGGVWEIDNISVRELKGNHATQSITASRPVLSARKNLLTKTEDFSAGEWFKALGFVSGRNLFTPDTTTGIHRIAQSFAPTLGVKYQVSGRVKGSGFRYVYVNTGEILTAKFVIDTQTGAYINDAQQPASNIVVSVASDGYIDFSYTGIGTSKANNIWLQANNTFVSNDDSSVTGNGVNGFYLDKLDIRYLETIPTRYQRVNTATDYDTAGFPRYLRFDGVDDYLNLPYMGLYANGSASCVEASAAGAHAGRYSQLLCESSGVNTNCRYSLSLESQMYSKGAFIRGDNNTVDLEVEGTQPVTIYRTTVVATTDTGSKIKTTHNSVLVRNTNYARANPVNAGNTTIGAAVTTTASLFYVGDLYGLLITKSALSDADRRKCEVYLGRKAGVTL